MYRVALIGAGSVTFAQRIVNDLLFRPAFEDAEFRLMDIDESRLHFSTMTMNEVNRARGTRATFVSTTDRARALDGADFVVTMIQVGGDAATRVDFDVCRRHGLKLVIGDSMGIPAVSRALRTIPAMLEIVRDMERLCPDAVLLNYTNPMGMIMAAVLRGSRVRGVGLCHGVVGTARKLAGFIGVDFDRVNYLCAGINHMAWFLRYEVDGVDAYPRIREAFDTRHKGDELVRQELFRQFGYFMTESSYHIAEYVPYFLKRDDLIAEYDIAIDEYLARSAENLEIFTRVEEAFRAGRNVFAEGAAVRFEPKSRMRRGHAEPGELVEAFRIASEPSTEYAAGICNAIAGGERFLFNGNVLNTGLITNLPANSCVEVPCVVDRNGIQPTHVGELPPQCAALTQTNVNVQELTVRALLDESREHLMHAALMCPHGSSVLSTREIRALMTDLIAAHGDQVPAWSRA